MNQLVLRRHPFDQDTGVFPVRAGQTLGAMLREGSQGAELSALLVVRIGGIEVPRHMWDRVRPKEGTAIHVTGTVAGNSAVLRSVLMIAVAVFAFYAAPFLVGAFGIFAGASASMVTAGIYALGSLLVNALVPLPKPPTPSGTDGRWNMLTGTQNGMNPYGAIPCVLGASRFYPPHAAMPYSVSVGEDSYQYCLFDLGFLTEGAEVTDLRIGNTAIESFEGVTYEITTTPTIYTADVSEVAVSAAMAVGDVVERTTAVDTEEIVIDIVFPTGLFGVGTSGKDFAMTSYWDFKYREFGSTTWLPLPAGARLSGMSVNGTADGTHKVYGMRKKPFAVGVAFDVPDGQYEVQVKRRNVPQGNKDNTYIYDATWTVLKSVRHVNPSITGTTKLAMRIKANDQLNGTLQTLSCHVAQNIPTYIASTDTWVNQLTTNTAWVVYWLMTQCPATHTHVPAARMSLADWETFANFCEDNELETRRVVDGRQTMADLLHDLLSASLASLGTTNGKYAPVWDRGETTESMVFSELESGAMQVQRIFARMPHALRVRFKNVAADWADDEIMVLDDGYSYRGVDARGAPSSNPEPERFDTLELRIACYPAQAWRLARFHLAQLKFRPSTYTWQADVSALGVLRGDLVAVQSPVTEWGAGAGFVRTVAGTTVTLDQEIETDPLKTYRAQTRRVVGGSVVVEAFDVTPAAAVTRTFTFASAPTLAQGDAVVIGETTRGAQKVLVTGVSPGQDQTFSLAGVAYDPRVGPYWANPPATFISEVTGGMLEPPDPPDVTIISNPDTDPRTDDGTTTPTIQVGIGGGGGFIRDTDWGLREFRTVLQ